MSKELMQRWFREVWTEGREESIDELLDPSIELHGVGPEPIRGIEAFKEFWRATRERFPNMSITVHRQVVDGDQFAAHCTSEFDDPLTGNRLGLRGATFATVRDGKFVEASDTWDFGALLEQAGQVEPGAVMRMLAPEPPE